MEKELILKLKEENEEKLAKLLEAREAEIANKVEEFRQSLEAEESAEIIELRKIIAGLDEMLCPPQEEAKVIEEPVVEEIPCDVACDHYCDSCENVECKESEDKVETEPEIPCEEQASEEIPCEAEAPVEPTPVDSVVETPIEEPVEAEVSIEEPIIEKVEEAPKAEPIPVKEEPKPKRDLFTSFKIR